MMPSLSRKPLKWKVFHVIQLTIFIKECCCSIVRRPTSSFTRQYFYNRTMIYTFSRIKISKVRSRCTH
ncbi:putative clathrin assembly protein isoform X1 [Iris pallida]|nr:putative clathrin assembly protein isoform X1 [Iris pallida]